MKIIRKFLLWAVGIFLVSTILSVVIIKYLPVYFTPLMVIRCFEKKQIVIHHNWVPLTRISKHMPVAVMASEDQLFLQHHGFDYKAIEKAAIHNMKNNRRTVRGASTISQQTAKNVFLWPGRSWIRKGLEVYFTTLIELMWSKQRIMEVYLNSIEMGNMIYGVDAVAKWHFSKTASELTRSECALIAATLPNPLRFDSSNPSPYIRKRQQKIEHEMKFIRSFPIEAANSSLGTNEKENNKRTR